MHDIVKKRKNELAKLCRQLRIKRMYVFGSASSGQMTAASDIDFLIAFDDSLSINEYSANYFTLHERLRHLFRREIDVVTEPSLSNPYFINSINRTKELIYGTDSEISA
ncbi:MAG: nucleotidyltransferase domain-containing protein [Tannerella sp.]|jgi:predicted nucleotidyltransferase|nr:nucleotidyltransferase domain-containing protein [Tannerella sp.]